MSRIYFDYMLVPDDLKPNRPDSFSCSVTDIFTSLRNHWTVACPWSIVLMTRNIEFLSSVECVDLTYPVIKKTTCNKRQRKSILKELQK